MHALTTISLAHHLKFYIPQISRRFFSLDLLYLQHNSDVLERMKRIRNCRYYEFSDSHQVSLARSFTLLTQYNKTHYVFHHGQNSLNGLILNIVNNILIDKGEIHFPFSCHLRNPICLKDIKLCQNVEWYTSRMDHENNDHTHRKVLISADGYLASTECAESALSFFSGVHACFSYKKIQGEALQEIIGSHVSTSHVQSQIIEELNQINSCLNKGSILYTICVPKENFEECGYLSQSYGVKFETPDPIGLLEKMQNEIELEQDFPQVRLLAHKLDACRTKIFMFPTVSNQEILDLADKIQSIFQKYSIFFIKEDQDLLPD